MNHRVLKNLILIAVCAPSIAQAATWTGKTVGNVQPNHPSIDCYWFRLNGVGEADPVTPGNPWFAVARTELGSREAYATLLAAKVAGAPVTVYTDGTTVCGGYARAIYVVLD